MEKYKKLEIHDFKDFKYKIKYEKGVLTLHLTSWVVFHKVVQKFKNNPDYIWRGQRCYPEEFNNEKKTKEWKLISSFYRKFSEEKNKKQKLNQIHCGITQSLKNLSNTYNINYSKKDEIWAIGQHHGLPTPLFDWSEDPYIAAYFAFNEKSNKNQLENTENRVIYALNKVVKLLIIKEKDIITKKLLSRQRNIEFDFDISKNNLRLIKQKSKFTKAFKGDDIKSIVEKFYDKTKNKYKNKIILVEILIPDKERNECLITLKTKKITKEYLFPNDLGEEYDKYLNRTN